MRSLRTYSSLHWSHSLPQGLAQKGRCKTQTSVWKLESSSKSPSYSARPRTSCAQPAPIATTPNEPSVVQCYRGSPSAGGILKRLSTPIAARF
jgi:hypothetical protein